MKSGGFGSPVEWHQDWAFYPHTNQDVLAVGILLDDMDADNGPLMMAPSSHRGPVFGYHSDGAFCGAINVVKGCRRDDSTGGVRQRWLDHHSPCASGPRIGDEPI